MDLLIEDDLTALIYQDDLNTDFNPEITVEENLLAPIASGKVVGKISYNIDGIEYSSNLIASHNVEKSSFIFIVFRILLIILILFTLYKLLFNNNSSNKKRRKKIYKRL